MTKLFSKILIANRGEIALRINRAAKELGIQTVAIYTESERNNLHVTQADFSESLGSGDLSQTYLNIEKIIAIAHQTGAEAIHPGYGFLSENANFADACARNGIKFIGPAAEALEKMGNKITAKDLAKSAGVNVLGSLKIDHEHVDIDASTLNYPVLIKASFGGGGKGMQIVRSAAELNEKLQTASRSAKSYFGNGEIYLEDYVENARHIEVQILGDQHGQLVHLFERDCTLQRNHQKIVEEAPATCISNELRNELHRAALAIGEKVAYQNAGTVEFLVDQNNQYYFLEMNPRIQVEHPVTEQITGIDVVTEQIRIAAGMELSFQQKDIKVSGHSIELRVYQEDPANNFSPSSKSIEFFQLPDSTKFRIETDLDARNSAVQFDPLLLKLIVSASDRSTAISTLIKGLNTTFIEGPATNLNYLHAILQHSFFKSNTVSTTFLSEYQTELLKGVDTLKAKIDKSWIIAGALIPSAMLHHNVDQNIWKEIGKWRLDQHHELLIDGVSHQVEWKFNEAAFSLKSNNETVTGKVISFAEDKLKIVIGDQIKEIIKISLSNGQTRIGVDGFIIEVFCTDVLSEYPEVDSELHLSDLSTNGHIHSHLHGKVVSINIKENQTVEKGETMLVIESMKSENAIVATKKAKIKNIAVAVGDQITDGMALIFLEEEKL